MQIASHQWSRAAPLAPQPPAAFAAEPTQYRSLYRELLRPQPSARAREAGRELLRRVAADARCDCNLPDDLEDLEHWMELTARTATAKYGVYLQQRREGAPRRYFTNRAHALHFLRNVAPTKLVDGAWLHGLVERQDDRLHDLVRTYVEELGDGSPQHNHVLLYRRLLDGLGLQPDAELPDDRYAPGAVQLALARNPQLLPEIVGFNLGYEQLPLHLLITAYELDELGIDPYYFTLHITVDNAHSGHARRAVRAVRECMPRFGDGTDFWRRVRAGCRASEAGPGTTDVIAGFDIEAEALRILRCKAAAGHGAHSDHCKVAGRSINEWLADPAQMPAFVQTLQSMGWIRRDAPAAESRFWKLLQGGRAPMLGVFDGYELQVIHDWLRGDASRDGASWQQAEAIAAGETVRVLPHRVAARKAGAPADTTAPGAPPDDPETEAMLGAWRCAHDAAQRRQVLARAMDPSMHWTPAGLHATRLFAAAS